MSIEMERQVAREQALSALADGELDATATASLCTGWGEHAQTRAAWHAYQLIGDVLRSDDLASTPAHDAAFLTSLRARLADEPTVLAPQPVQGLSELPQSAVLGRRLSKRTWLASAAMAAGFVMVAGATLVIRAPGPQADADRQLVVNSSGATRQGGGIETVSHAAPAREVAEATVVATDPRLIRDARLDRYLAAHKQFSGSSVLGVPSAFLRDSATDAPAR